MEIKVKIGSSGPSFLSKLTAIFFGIFVTTIIFALSMRISETYGIYGGLAVSAILIFLGFYYVKKGTTLRFITWGILGTVIVSAIALVVGVQILESLLEGF